MRRKLAEGRTSAGNLRLAAAFMTALLISEAHGAGWKLDDARTEPGRFFLGMLSGIAGHELGHYLVARSRGYKVSREGWSVTYPDADFTPAGQLQVASAGFQVQWLLAEMALRDGEGRELRSAPESFDAGLVCAHLGITAAYLVSLKDHELGDVVGMEQATGLSSRQIMLALAVPGVLDAWRLFGEDVPAWVPELSVLGKGLGMIWVWTY